MQMICNFNRRPPERQLCFYQCVQCGCAWGRTCATRNTFLPTLSHRSTEPQRARKCSNVPVRAGKKTTAGEASKHGWKQCKIFKKRHLTFNWNQGCCCMSFHKSHKMSPENLYTYKRISFANILWGKKWIHHVCKASRIHNVLWWATLV